MDIRNKEDGTIVRDVTEAHEYGYKWVKYLPGSRTEYSWEYWEPVEEWVKIEVRKREWDRVDSDGVVFMSRTPQRYHFGVSWRYPQ